MRVVWARKGSDMTPPHIFIDENYNKLYKY